MKTTFLEFEQPIAELEAKIDELRYVQDDSALDISEEIGRLQKKSNTLTKEIYGKLYAWQIAQVARHPQRPYTLDYVGEPVRRFPGAARRSRVRRRSRRSSAGSRASTVRRVHGASATRRAATPKRRCCATSACRGPRAIARRCA